MESNIVQILEAESGKAGSNLDRLRDPVTGEYFYPLFSQQMLDYRNSFLTNVKTPLHSTITAIIDSGLMHDHPLIKGKIIDEVDLVGEGAEDLNGHGTAVCLNLLMYNSNTKLLNIKALNAQGEGTKKSLIDAFKWIIDWKNNNAVKERIIVNISAGVYGERWGFLPCKGGCDVCQAAEEAVANNIIVFAAAGNEHGKTACPANAKSVIPVASVKHDGTRLKNSGNAEVESFGNLFYGKPEKYTQLEIETMYKNLEKDQ